MVVLFMAAGLLVQPEVSLNEIAIFQGVTAPDPNNRLVIFDDQGEEVANLPFDEAGQARWLPPGRGIFYHEVRVQGEEGAERFRGPIVWADDLSVRLTSPATTWLKQPSGAARAIVELQVPQGAEVACGPGLWVPVSTRPPLWEGRIAPGDVVECVAHTADHRRGRARLRLDVRVPDQQDRLVRRIECGETYFCTLSLAFAALNTLPAKWMLMTGDGNDARLREGPGVSMDMAPGVHLLVAQRQGIGQVLDVSTPPVHIGLFEVGGALQTTLRERMPDVSWAELAACPRNITGSGIALCGGEARAVHVLVEGAVLATLTDAIAEWENLLRLLRSGTAKVVVSRAGPSSKEVVEDPPPKGPLEPRIFPVVRSDPEPGEEAANWQLTIALGTSWGWVTHQRASADLPAEMIVRLSRETFGAIPVHLALRAAVAHNNEGRIMGPGGEPLPSRSLRSMGEIQAGLHQGVWSYQLVGEVCRVAEKVRPGLTDRVLSRWEGSGGLEVGFTAARLEMASFEVSLAVLAGGGAEQPQEVPLRARLAIRFAWDLF